MIRFVDIKTGNIFNGEYPYIFWFDGEQSINLWYNKPICFISHSQFVNVSINNNDVFKLLDHKYIDENLGLEYINIKDIISESNNIILKGTKYKGLYVYLFYIISCTETVGEYLESFYITENNETIEYKIGADFYGENEFNLINLSNLGVEIPNTIQKALYPFNIHEDKTDNILLNRKWKELLSNYWDVIANKGSYKSLFNSLKWFEYGDKIKLFELWKHNDLDKVIYDERGIKDLLSDKYFETLNGFSKTTYIAISAALEKMSLDNDGNIEYDRYEKNPILEQAVFDWSINDLSLKLSMLGSFYETFFMPIHLDLIRSTIEDVVYSNTIKLCNCVSHHREDVINHIEDIICNVKDNDIFRLGPTSARVGKDTMFGNQYKDFSSYKADIIGVQRENPTFYPEYDMESQIKTYNSQHFNAIGVIIDFKINIPLNDGDFIKRSVLSAKGDKTNEWITIEDRKLFGKDIEFSILCTKEQTYDFRLQFESANGKVYTKRVVINVIDDRNTELKLYKIQNIGVPDLENRKTNKFAFGRMLGNNNNELYKQYIPAKNINPRYSARWDYKGICLNNLLIIKDSKPITNDKYINENYFVQIRPINDKLYYTICLSKQYGFLPNYKKLTQYHIYRDQQIFYPDFHELVEFGTKQPNEYESLDLYTITDEDSLCIIPELSYGKLIKEAQWEFVNVSKPNSPSIIPSQDINEPFITNDKESFLSPGYYNIIFKYKLSGEDQINTIVLDSAFLKK